MEKLRQRYAQVEAKRTALEEEQGSLLENQIEIDRLKQVEKNLLRDINNKEKEIKALQEQQQQQQKEHENKLKNIGKLKIELSAKTKERNKIEAGPLTS